MSINKNQFSRKENRDAVFNNGLSRILGLLGNHEVMDVFKSIFELRDYYETQISDLKKIISSLRKKIKIKN